MRWQRIGAVGALGTLALACAQPLPSAPLVPAAGVGDVADKEGAATDDAAGDEVVGAVDAGASPHDAGSAPADAPDTAEGAPDASTDAVTADATVADLVATDLAGADVPAPPDVPVSPDVPAPLDIPAPPDAGPPAKCTPASCDDGNVCTADGCDPAVGCSHQGTSGACSDGNACNGGEQCNPASSQCQGVPLVCPQAPPECNQTGGSGSPTANQVKSVSAAGFRLVDTSTWTANAGIIAQLGQHPSVKPVNLGTVTGDLNRVATKISKFNDLPCLATGFEWEAGDQAVSYWIPQGIAGSAAATADGTWQGKKLLIVSWYHQPKNEPGAPDKGARLAVVDVTNMAAIKYRLVLLADVVAGNPANLKPVQVHAGGLAWWDHYLYVVDTDEGLRVFDLNQMLQVQTGKNDSIGLVAGSYHAFGYKYVLPQVGFYKLCGGSCCARFSFGELDLSSSPPSLVTGEYSVDTLLGRVHRWPLDPATHRMATVNGVVQASEVLFPGVVKMQGAQLWQGHLYVSSSAPKKSGTTSAGSLFHGKVGGAIQTLSWPHHPEDLHLAPASGNLWSLTEDVGERAVFAVKLSDIQAGCGK